MKYIIKLPRPERHGGPVRLAFYSSQNSQQTERTVLLAIQKITRKFSTNQLIDSILRLYEGQVIFNLSLLTDVLLSNIKVKFDDTLEQEKMFVLSPNNGRLQVTTRPGYTKEITFVNLRSGNFSFSQDTYFPCPDNPVDCSPQLPPLSLTALKSRQNDTSLYTGSRSNVYSLLDTNTVSQQGFQYNENQDD